MKYLLVYHQAEMGKHLGLRDEGYQGRWQRHSLLPLYRTRANGWTWCNEGVWKWEMSSLHCPPAAPLAHRPWMIRSLLLLPNALGSSDRGCENRQPPAALCTAHLLAQLSLCGKLLAIALRTHLLAWLSLQLPTVSCPHGELAVLICPVLLLLRRHDSSKLAEATW